MPRHEEAEYAFQMLGTNAVSAVPELVRIYEEDISESSQRCTASALGHIGRGAEAALPMLIQRFTHTNQNVRFYAVWAVMNIGGKAAVVVPALTTALKDSSVDVRWNALVGLSRFGARARPAVPEILKMRNDSGMVGSHSIRKEVDDALWAIAPEQVGKPVIVEDATPIIANGVTTQAVKVFSRESARWSVIQEGCPVPAGAYWSSHPRPRLSLYRGSSTSDDADRFLGHFEILGLPASDKVNVSLCVIVVNGQIILSARDEHRDTFLEIRRVEAEAVK